MKTEFTDVSETQKTLTIEIPSDVVDAEINRVAKGYTKQARIPGFRPGKVPATIIKQRFRDQILHDVMHGLIPRAVEEALQERGIEPVDTPNIKDVALEEGQPLKFTAAIETVPPFDPGDLTTLTLRRPLDGDRRRAVDETLQRLRERGGEVRAGRRAPGRRRRHRGARHRAHGRRRRASPTVTRTSSLELGAAGQPARVRRESASA